MCWRTSRCTVLFLFLGLIRSFVVAHSFQWLEGMAWETRAHRAPRSLWGAQTLGFHRPHWCGMVSEGKLAVASLWVLSQYGTLQLPNQNWTCVSYIGKVIFKPLTTRLIIVSSFLLPHTPKGMLLPSLHTLCHDDVRFVDAMFHQSRTIF